MAVQKSKVTRSRRNQRRTHDSLSGPTLSTDKTTGEVHRRHHMTADGFYKGKKSFGPWRRISSGAVNA
jgi:large subunit ribosomal protein L32